MTTKAIVTYLCSDGIPHVFDAADRKIPICGLDVWIVGELGGSMAPSCELCADKLLDVVTRRLRRGE